MPPSVARALRDPLAANLGRVRERVARACLRAGREPGEVSLVAVTKYAGPSLVATLLELGQVDLGENRAERIVALDAQLPVGLPRPRWHMVGHLQRNKARKVAGLLAALHSLDSAELARKLDERRRELSLDSPIATWVEVNLGNEEQKSGVAPDAVEAFAREVAALERVRVQGLMAIPPAADEAESSRPHFRRLRELLPALERGLGRRAAALSMGMTHDLEVAVEEGATVVRIGRALLEGIAQDVLDADAQAVRSQRGA
jgi:pyridoxal phosphate enzyme (YggS family)